MPELTRLFDPLIRELERQARVFYQHLHQGECAPRTCNTKLAGAEMFIKFLRGERLVNRGNAHHRVADTHR